MGGPYGPPPVVKPLPPLHLPRGLPALKKDAAKDDDKDRPPEEQPMTAFVGKLPPDVPVG